MQAWDQLKAMVSGQLMVQSHVADLFQQVPYLWDAEIENLEGDFSEVGAMLTARIETDRAAGLDDLREFVRAARGMGLLERMDLDGFRAQLALMGADATLALNQVLAGWGDPNAPTQGDDLLLGTDGNDRIDGRGGNDRIYGRATTR